jgi:hypothetical protein
LRTPLDAAEAKPSKIEVVWSRDAAHAGHVVPIKEKYWCVGDDEIIGFLDIFSGSVAWDT